jgi:hypothetical protein
VVTSRQRVLGALVLAGLALRTAFAGLFHARQVEGLTVSYFDSATALALGDPFRVAEGVEILHPYGYSVLIVAVRAVTGTDDTAALVVLAALQVVVDTSAILLMYVAGRNLHSPATGLWIAAVYALNPLIALAAVEPIPESLSPFLMAAFLASGSMIWCDRGRWALWAGVTCGVAAQFRSEFLLLPIVLAGYIVLMGRARVEVRRIAMMLGLVAAFMLPMVLGTWIQTGTPRVNTTNLGGTMWQALGEKPDNPWGLQLGDHYVVEESRRLGFPSPWGPEANDHFKREAIRDIRAHPGYFTDLVVRHRIPRVFDTEFARWNYVQYAVGIWQVDTSIARYDELREEGLMSVASNDPRLVIVSGPVGSVIRALLTISYVALALYLIANLRRPRRLLLIALPFAYVVASLCLLKFVEPRQFFVLLPLYAFALGATMHWLWARVQSRTVV